MPSIEIVCVGQKEPTTFLDLPFLVFAEDELVSHRTPRPLFKADFDDTAGCIYHLCNIDGAYTAYTLLSRNTVEEFGTVVKFAPEFVPAVRHILGSLIVASPAHLVLFTSDYQFGPDEIREQTQISLAEFWHRHDEEKIAMNALYKIAE